MKRSSTPARTRLRYGCSIPAAVSVGSPQLQAAHARAVDGRANTHAASTITVAVLRAAISHFLGRVAIRRGRVVGHHLADVAFRRAAVARRAALFVTLAGRDHAGAGADRAGGAVAVAVAVGLAVAVGMIDGAEEASGAALIAGGAWTANRQPLDVRRGVGATRDADDECNKDRTHAGPP